MVYTERKNLTVLELKEERDVLSYDELIPLLRERPSHVIYVELKGTLYGIVSMGDINTTLSYEKRHTAINKRFTAVHPEKNAYLESRRIFKEKEKIKFVPVVDSEGRLLGEWARINNFATVSYAVFAVNHSNAAARLKGLKLVLVKPCAVFEKKRKTFWVWKRLLEKKGAVLEIINYKDVAGYLSENREKPPFLLIDDAESSGVDAWLNMENVGENSFTLPRLLRYETFLRDIGKNWRSDGYGIKEAFYSLQAQNITVLGLDFQENEHGYLKKFRDIIREKYRQRDIAPSNGRLYPEVRKDFLCELYEKEEYKKQYFPLKFRTILTKDGFHILEDADTSFFSTCQGKRRTVDQPEAYDRCVYVVGPCIILGSYVEDQYTIPRLLQRELNQAGFSCKVINLGALCAYSNQGIVKVLKEAINEQIRKLHKYVCIRKTCFENPDGFIFAARTKHPDFCADCEFAHL